MNRHARMTAGTAGIATVILIFTGQGLIQVGGGEPAFSAAAPEILRFFETRDPALFAAGTYLQTLGLVVFLWFVGAMYALLGAAGEWRATIALVSGVAFVAGLLTSSWQAAGFRADEGLDPELARFAFDEGNLAFAAGWVALGSFALASGWVIVSTDRAPRWLGWWAVAAGAGLAVAPTVWTTAFWFLPYSLFWIWVIVLSIRWLRRPAARPEFAGATS